MGDFVSARDHLKYAISLGGPMGTQRASLTVISILCWAAYALSRLGFPEQASQRSREALALARGSSISPFSLALVLVLSADFHDVRREGETALALVDEAIELANEHGFKQWTAVALGQRGIALIELNRNEEGVAAGREALLAHLADGMTLATPEVLASMAQGYLKLGDSANGLMAVEQGLGASAKTDERWYDAELHRLKGELLLNATDLLNHEQEAESCFRRALEIARDQQAKWWELRSTVNLARFLAKKGRAVEAREMLAHIYNWFT
jgi:tetratricopeptide (TPR) repeat protein